MLRLLTTVVFPSFGLALVNTRTRGRSPFLREKRIDVSVVRIDSATREVRCPHEIISTAPFPALSGVPFIAKFNDRLKKQVGGVEPAAMDVLSNYSWPGNIRELENVVERAIVLGSGDFLSPDSLPPHLHAPRDEQTVNVEIPPTGMDLEGTLTRIENRYIRLALERSGWLQIRAAELLGLSFRQFRYKLQKHGLRAGRGGPKPPVQS